MLSVEVLQLGLSAPVMLSDSDRSGSQADRGLENVAMLPVILRAGDSAWDMADPGGAGKLQYLRNL